MHIIAAIFVLMVIFAAVLANARPTLAELNPHGSRSASHVLLT